MPTPNPFDPFKPRRPNNGPAFPPPVPTRAGAASYLPYVTVLAVVVSFWAFKYFDGKANPLNDPLVTAGRQYAESLGPAWADSLAAHLSAAKEKKTAAEARDAKDAAFKAASDAAFTRLVLPALTSVAPDGPDPDDPASLAAYEDAVGRLQKGARGR